MTCKDKDKSIPDGSFVLANELNLKYEDNGKSEIKDPNGFLFLPMEKPLLIVLQDPAGKEHLVCKTFTFIDNVSKVIRFFSYNLDYKDRYIPMSHIKKVFEVQKVFKTEKEISQFD